MSTGDAREKMHTTGRLPLWAMGLILVLIGIALFGEKGILRALQFGRQKAELEAKLQQLEQVNAELRREIEALHSDRRTIEQIARKELGMVREDELVYQFPGQKAPPPAPKPAQSER